jgi:hypothetical protein
MGQDFVVPKLDLKQEVRELFKDSVLIKLY